MLTRTMKLSATHRCQHGTLHVNVALAAYARPLYLFARSSVHKECATTNASNLGNATYGGLRAAA
eukprot:7672059-Alexandrium_andersonii.AAC.1